MILLLGDIHGDVNVFARAVDFANTKQAAALIQVGDFGLFPTNEKSFHYVTKEANIPIYFIDGNHDDCTRWTKCKRPKRLWNNRNVWYLPRGTVMTLDGRTIAFMGGAGSIDKHTRLKYGWHWDEKENIDEAETKRMLRNAKNKKIDVLITHCPPHSVIEKNFSPLQKLQFGVGLDWKDPNQDIIENIWKKLGYPTVYSGHMHKTVVGGNFNILNINEIVSI